MKSFSDFEQIKNLAHPDQAYGCASFAQHGDDLMLVNLFALMSIQKPTFLDLGAHHPFIISNTALLYERGSRGVNVEANPNLIEAFRRYRPQDITVNVGVALDEGVFPFYMFSNSSGRNTFSKDEADSLSIPVRDVVNLPTMTIMQIVERYCAGRFPDLLLTDLEGLDYAILKSADFSKSKPKVIVTETRRGHAALVKELLSEQGYILYCRMGENLFFIENEFSYLVY